MLIYVKVSLYQLHCLKQTRNLQYSFLTVIISILWYKDDLMD